MTDLRTRTAEMLAYESNPSRDQWRKLVTDLLADEAAARDKALEDAASCFNDVPNVNFIRERIRALKNR